ESLKAQAERHQQLYNLESEGQDQQRQHPGKFDIDGRDERRGDRDGLEERQNEAFDAYLRGGIGVLNEEQRSLLATGRLPGSETRAAITTAGIGVVGTRPFSNELIKALRDFTGVLDAGARVITTGTGNPM